MAQYMGNAWGQSIWNARRDSIEGRQGYARRMMAQDMNRYEARAQKRAEHRERLGIKPGEPAFKLDSQSQRKTFNLDDTKLAVLSSNQLHPAAKAEMLSYVKAQAAVLEKKLEQHRLPSFMNVAVHHTTTSQALEKAQASQKGSEMQAELRALKSIEKLLSNGASQAPQASAPLAAVAARNKESTASPSDLFTVMEVFNMVGQALNTVYTLLTNAENQQPGLQSEPVVDNRVELELPQEESNQKVALDLLNRAGEALSSAPQLKMEQHMNALLQIGLSAQKDASKTASQEYTQAVNTARDRIAAPKPEAENERRLGPGMR